MLVNISKQLVSKYHSNNDASLQYKWKNGVLPVEIACPHCNPATLQWFCGAGKTDENVKKRKKEKKHTGKPRATKRDPLYSFFLLNPTRSCFFSRTTDKVVTTITIT